jgi:RimJ/RimL family protein N-acetyltransferase
MCLRLVKYDIEFLNLSWKWLNENEIKELTNTPDFSRIDQNKWFKNIIHIDNYLIWGVEYKKNKIGACGLKNICEEDGEYWGYIGEKDYWGKGLGNNMINSIIKIAYKKNLTSIWLKVLKSNHRAISLYFKLNFFIEEESENLLYMRKLL